MTRQTRDSAVVEGLAAKLGGCSRQVDHMNRVGSLASVPAPLAAAAAAAGEGVEALRQLERM